VNGNIVGQPVRKPVVTSNYGPRVLNGRQDFHAGIDFVEGEQGAAGPHIVYSVGAGEVVYDKDNYDDARWKAMMASGNITDWADSGGNMVIVKTDVPGLGARFVRYLHLRTNSVAAGQRVEAGQPIGMYDDVGYSYGAHLHLDVMPLDWSRFEDPRPVLAALGYTV
jgi:murein DD-endopeptidase MepM/ murein hydrolase activator NlpD